MNKTETFTHQGVSYEIRSLPFQDGYRAAVFHDGNRISPTFFVSHENDMDCAFYTGERGFDTLFRMIKHEILEGRIVVP